MRLVWAIVVCRVGVVFLFSFFFLCVCVGGGGC